MSYSRWGRSKPLRRGRRLPGCLLLVLSLFLGLLILAELRLAPLILEAASDKACSQVLSALNSAAAVQVEQSGLGDYQDVMYIERDAQGRVTLLAPDAMSLNRLITATTREAVDSLEQLQGQSLSLPLGALTGSSLLAGLGPEVRVRFRALGRPAVVLEDEFTSAGVNQVRHSIWLKLSAQVRILIPFSRHSSEVSATILLCEGVIVGYTPDTYVGLSAFGGQN